ncbi:MAG: YaaR family protein [Clostridiaceae bacterium]|nr:YaaR family protein [Clostridiaceae bacterium]
MSRIDAINITDNLNRVEPQNRRVTVKKEQFASKFENIKSQHVRSHLEGLYDKIVDQGEKISEKQHLSEIVKYRKLVQEFLDVAVKNSHQFSKQNFLDRRGRHRVYCIVKSVDRELDELTKDFLNQEGDGINILGRLDDIKGMLLDIFM